MEVDHILRRRRNDMSQAIWDEGPRADKEFRGRKRGLEEREGERGQAGGCTGDTQDLTGLCTRLRSWVLRTTEKCSNY